MDHDLLLARSITQAQHMQRALGSCGIRAAMQRAPAGLTDRGCAYALRLRTGQLRQAMSCLQAAGLRPLAAYHHGPGGYREAEL